MKEAQRQNYKLDRNHQPYKLALCNSTVLLLLYTCRILISQLNQFCWAKWIQLQWNRHSPTQAYYTSRLHRAACCLSNLGHRIRLWGRNWNAKSRDMKNRGREADRERERVEGRESKRGRDKESMLLLAHCIHMCNYKGNDKTAPAGPPPLIIEPLELQIGI